MEQRTAQEIFDTVVKGVIAQGHASVDRYDSSKCKYRGAGGAKCAAGFLLSDEDAQFLDRYQTGINRAAADEVVERSGLLGERKLVTQLQRAHDNAHTDDMDGFDPFLVGFAEQARAVAAAHGLDANALDACPANQDQENT